MSATVSRAMDDIRELLRRHLPAHTVTSVTRIGRGAEHVAYEVSGELIVRVRTRGEPDERSAAVARDARLLEAVGALSPIAVPQPLFVDESAGVLAYRKLPGTPLSDPAALAGAQLDAAQLASGLADLLNRIHGTATSTFAELVPSETASLDAWLTEAKADYASAADHLPRVQQAVVEAFLARTPPPDPARKVFCHNDLGAEHVLVDPDTGAVTGVLDWSDAAFADPVVDFARIYRDLGPGFVYLTLAHYDGRWTADDMDRAAFYARCTLIEDLAYGIATGERRYSDAAIANLQRTFT